MRTTLKRGIGRGASLNGNGHSAAPPLFGPITRYRQPEPPRRSVVGLILRGFGWLVLALAVVVSGIGGGLYLYDHQSLASIKATGATKIAVRKLRPLPSVNSPAIALVAGYDHRAGSGTSAYAGSNSDTLMLLRANPQNHSLSLLSFPRDLNVPIYCKGDVVSTHDRINAAWADCGTSGGPYAAVDTMEHLTGLPINYLITLDFHAFKQIVNRLHGVYMNVDRRYYNPLHTGWSAINLQPGYQKLDGGQALSFVRFRHLDSDIYRNGRQQLFMEALKARIRSSISLSNLFVIPKLIGALKGNLQVAKAGGGAVTNDELKSYLDLADSLPPGHLVRNAIPIADLQTYITSGGADELKASPAAIQGAVHNFLHPPVLTVKPAGVPSTGTTHHAKNPKGPSLPRKDVSVLVLNAGHTAGEASNTTYLLTKRGFDTKTLPASTPADAPSTAQQTTVYYDPVQPNAKKAAQELAPLFGAHSVVAQMTSSIASFAQKAHNPLVVVAVGTSFSGKLTLPHSTKPAQSKIPPSVQDGVSATAAAIRAENGPAHFPLMIPHEIALGSALSSDEGVRLFKPLAGKQELALTFNVNGGVEYWQIEETNWTSAPILSNPSGRFSYKGRTYSYYTSGGQIQMIVLHVGNSGYWVVNSILNELSNQTMIAIAESLQPLGR